MSSPSKRRRTSSTTYVTADYRENQHSTGPKPTTPQRASYQSPTKASLARSNPKVLQEVAQAKERRESEPNRGRSLRDVVLGNKSILPESQAKESNEDQATTKQTAESVPATVTNEHAIALDIAGAFKDISQPQPAQGGPSPSPSSPPPNIPTPRHIGLVPFASPSIVPKLVESASNIHRRSERSSSAELPLTPVRLGSHARPDRPRGLASSSPGASGRRRLRVREGQIISSPLKPKTPAPISVASELGEDLDHAEAASGIGDDPDEQVAEAHEEDIMDVDEEPYDPDIREKQSQLRRLQARLEDIHQECEKLSSLGSMILGDFPLSQFPQDNFEENIDLLLQSQRSSDRAWPPRVEDHDLFKKNSPAYLTLFTPGNLRLSHYTKQKISSGRHKLVKRISVTAPEPWPAHILNVTFDATIDLESNATEQIIFTNALNQPPALRTWIDGRLNDPVSRTDLAIIVTGIAHYFEEDIKRARTLKYLSERLFSSNSDSLVLPDVENLSAKETILLLPYLNRTQDTFPSSHRDQSSTSSTSKQIMLIYEISLNWIGQPTTIVGICGSGFGKQAMKYAKTLFREVKSVDGVVKAFEAVWQVLSMDRTHDSEGTGVGKPKGKKKARRMTEFA